MNDELIKIGWKAVNAAVDLLLENTNTSHEHIDDDTKAVIDKIVSKHFCDILDDTNIPVLSEESIALEDIMNGDYNSYWLVDPLDGTLNYVKGSSIWGINLSLNIDGTWRASWLYSNLHKKILFTDESFVLDSSLGSLLDNSREKVLFTGIPSGITINNKWLQVIRSFKKTRMLGSASCSIASVVCGEGDVYYEGGIFLWDVIAGIHIAKSKGIEFSFSSLEGNRCEIYLKQ